VCEGTSVPRKDAGSAKPLGRVESFLRDRYVPMLFKKFFGFPVSVPLLAVLFCFVGIMVFYCTELSAPTSREEWFTDDHMFTGLLDSLSSDFLGSQSNTYVALAFSFGISGLDRSGFDMYDPGNEPGRGVPQFDPAFSLHTLEAQNGFKNSCRLLRNAPCTVGGCTFGKLALPDTLQCFMEDLDVFARSKGLAATPTDEDAFISLLVQFREARPDLAPNIGIIDGKLKFARILFTSTLTQYLPGFLTKPVYNRAEEAVQQLKDVVPKSMQSILQSSTEGDWDWLITRENLLSGLFSGFSICFPVAFVVLVYATQNFVIGFYAVASIAAIVGCVLGSAYTLGWSLGLAESIAGVIVIGFSVDYVVHIGHMYSESPALHSEQRAEDAAGFMGKTVIGGAITTLGAGVFLMGCQMIFFRKMGILIALTITYSLGFAMVLFLSVVGLFGPARGYFELETVKNFIFRKVKLCN